MDQNQQDLISKSIELDRLIENQREQQRATTIKPGRYFAKLIDMKLPEDSRSGRLIFEIQDPAFDGIKVPKFFSSSENALHFTKKMLQQLEVSGFAELATIIPERRMYEVEIEIYKLSPCVKNIYPVSGGPTVPVAPSPPSPPHYDGNISRQLPVVPNPTNTNPFPPRRSLTDSLQAQRN